MRLTLQETMHIFPFSEAKLVAGTGGLNRMVASANIQEVPDVDKWLKGGEILFSAGYAFRTASEGVKLLKILHQKEVAALALKPGYVMDRIPQEMMDCADELDFPLFELPQDLPYMDCIIPIFERLTQKRLYVLERMEAIHNRLTQVMIQNKGLFGICYVLSQVTGHYVSILSPAGKVLALHEGTITVENYEQEIQTFFEKRIHKHQMNRLNPNKCNEIQKDSMSISCIPIVVNDDLLAYLSLDVSQRNMEPEDYVIFENASSLISIELLKEQNFIAQEQKVRGQLLDDLLFRRYQDEKIVIRRGKYLGVDLAKENCVFILGIDSFEEHLGSSKRFSEPKIQKIKADIQHMLYDGIKQYPRPVLLTESGTNTIGMLSISSPDDINTGEKILSHVLEQLMKKYQPLTFSVGFGKCKTGISQIAESYKEAKQALKSGRLIKHPVPGIHITHFEDLGCLCFLSELSSSQAMKDFCQEYLGNLLAYDVENDACLVDTLKTYFSCGSNLRKTADTLYVHKNTVIYRLGKIESLLGKSIHDCQTAFHLQLCLQLLEII